MSVKTATKSTRSVVLLIFTKKTKSKTITPLLKGVKTASVTGLICFNPEQSVLNAKKNERVTIVSDVVNSCLSPQT